MKKRSLPLLIFVLLLLPSLSMAINQTNKIHTTTNTIKPTEQTLYVDDDNMNGPWNGTVEHPYQYIHQAVENATDGDTIFVFNGIYTEYVVINKQLIILGENNTSTIIDGKYHEFIIEVTVPGVIIQGFTLRNAGGGMTDAALKITAPETVIDHCIFYRTKTGVSIRKTNHSQIRYCSFYSNGEGIGIYSSSICSISQCYFTHNAIGVNLDQAHSITINECYAQTNGIGFYFYRSSNSTAISCAAYDNNDNQGGFFLKLSTYIMISDCNINHNGVGVRMADSANIYVVNSDLLANTHAAVWIDSSSKGILIDNCDIHNNKRFAAILGTTNCTFNLNNIYNSLFGIYGENSDCDARYNWWGSPLGPALFDRTTKDRVKMKNGTITVFPWRFRFSPFTSAGSTWEINPDLYHVEFNTSRYTEIALPGDDTDHDSVPDWWEIKWGYDPNVWDDHTHLDPDGDGLNSIEECYTDQWDSNPFQKDLFLEIDWMKSHNNNASNKPTPFYLKKMIHAFEDYNITLHIDDGALFGGEEVTYRSNFSYAVLRDYYWNYFLHNDLNNPRKGIFHYCLISDYGPGPGFAFIGWDTLDAFQISAQTIADKGNHYLYPRSRLIVGGIIHELGHTLGLNVDDYEGNDNKVTTMLFTSQWLKYRTYRSCMNYWYTYTILDYSDGSHGKNDFDDWSHMDFSFFKNTSFLDPLRP